MIAPSTLNDTHSDGDSDSDWDDDDDFGARKINIKIKPIAQVTPSKISASVDELRATVGTWKSLANINLIKPNSRRHHQSTVQLNNIENGIKHSGSILNPQSSANSIIISDGMLFPSPAENSNGLILEDKGFIKNQPQQQRYTINLSGMSHGNKLGDQMLVPNQFSARTTVPQDFGDYMRLDNPIFENDTKNLDILLKSSASSTLSPGLFSAFKRVSTSDKTVLPVAFAIQESLNVNSPINSTRRDSSQMIGSLKMAVPPAACGLYASRFEELLDVTLIYYYSHDIRLNAEFVSEISDDTPKVSIRKYRRLSINMNAVKDYVMKLEQSKPTKYILLPELLRYSIRSREVPALTMPGSEMPPGLSLSPLQVLAHWLCDLDTIKVRLYIYFIPNNVEGSTLTTDDIKNLSISLHVNGEVVSYQSRPDADWSPLDAKLTWSFSNLSELMPRCAQIVNASCLARFDLSNGPSTPGHVVVQFSINGKTISGTHIRINNSENFRLATQKFEVRTGNFKCLPPCV